MNLNPEYSRALGWNSQSSNSVLSLWGVLPSVLRDYSKDQQLILGELPYKVSERTATWIEGNVFPSSRGQLLFCQMEDPIALQEQPTNQLGNVSGESNYSHTQRFLPCGKGLHQGNFCLRGNIPGSILPRREGNS